MKEKTANNFKKLVLGVAFAALTLGVFPVAEKLIAETQEEKLVKEGLQELELEAQFKKSPFLYQRYEGYVDKYIKDAKNLTPAKSKQLVQAVAKFDKMYFDSLCEGNSYRSQFVYDTETKNGERRLVHTDESFVACEAESGYVEDFRFKREHCAPDRRVCNPHQFGQDVMCGCHGDHDPDVLMPIFNDKSTSSLNKANNKKIAMVQSMLNVQGR